ncbi:metallophosphoesterase family protein [Pseudacidovorax intermedius]|uniref:metallophosphoesterase family protein n=1 Tax=Pseudacidovorax intermedius TaxID=433924 RepID=UPI0009EA1382|nr:metallophosphoesterase family protein [Pseudacidovorax intermedius]
MTDQAATPAEDLSAQAGPAERDCVLLHLSDPHFGTEQPAVVEALVRWVRAQTADAVLVSGDITQRATRAQFEAARAFFGRLAAPRVLVIPGNHDIPLFDLGARLLAPYRRYQAALGRELEPELDLPHCLVLGAKTTRRWRHSDGQIGADQIERIAHRLATASPAQLRVVMVHQPVAVTRPEDHENLLHGREAALARWAEAGVDLVLGGHIHLPFAVPLPQAGGAWAVQAGTALSSRVRSGAPNSVNLLRWTGAGTGGRRRCTLERWDFDAARGDFALVLTDALELPPHGAAPTAPLPTA